MKRTSSFLFALIVCMVCSCGGRKSLVEKVEYLPFQSEEDGRWGMISPEGDVLFEEEFERRPTIAFNGRFFVENSDGLYEIYTADEKPKQVGEAVYKQIAPFTEDVTVAVEPNKGVTLIDLDGRQVADLSVLAEKKVQGVFSFSDGLAIFETTEGLRGAIDTKGKVVIQPEYAYLSSCVNGKLLAIEKRYKSALEEGNTEKIIATILDDTGSEISSFSCKKFSDVGALQPYADNLLLVNEAKEDHRQGLIDFSGEWVMKPTDKIKYVLDVSNDLVIYGNGDKVGLRQLKGEGIIRPKFDYMYFAADDILCALDESKDIDKRYALYDLQGERIGSTRFRTCNAFLGRGDYAPVEIEENEWGFVDRNGEILELEKIEIYRISFHTGNNYIESDLIDFEGIANNLKIKADGVDGMKLGWNVNQAIEHAHNIDQTTDQEADDYQYSSAITYTNNTAQFGWKVQATFTENLTTPITRYRDFGYGYGYNETVGYNFNTDARVEGLQATIECSGKLEGKSERLYKAILAKSKESGTILRSNSKSALLRFPNGHYAVVASTASQIFFLISGQDLSLYDLSAFETEDSDTEPYDSYGSYAADSAAFDSAMVDSVVVS